MPRAFKVLSKAPRGPVHLQAELARRSAANRQELERPAVDMKHVEAVIRMLDPEHDVRAISTKPAIRLWGSSGRCLRPGP